MAESGGGCETVVAGLPGVRRGGVAVFPATDPHHANERLVVLAETREPTRRIASGWWPNVQRGIAAPSGPNAADTVA